MTDLDALAAVPLFAALDQQRLRALATRSTKRVVDADCVVAVRGQPATRLIVVESGTLTATHDTAEGRRLRLGHYPAPCTVDKAAVLDGGGHTATWTAATRTHLRLIPAAELLAVIDDVPAVRHHVLRYLARDVRDQQDTLVRAAFADVTTRVAAWLVRAANQSGTTVVLPGAQNGLAEAIGATRVSVNRALRTLAAEGLVSARPGAVVIRSLDGLASRSRPE